VSRDEARGSVEGSPHSDLEQGRVHINPIATQSTYLSFTIWILKRSVVTLNPNERRQEHAADCTGASILSPLQEEKAPPPEKISQKSPV